MEVAKVLLRGIRGHPNGRCLQDDGPCEGKRELELVPAFQLNLVLHRDVKTENCGPGFPGEQYRTLLGHIPWSSGAIDGKGGVAALADMPGHFRKSTKATPGAGASRSAIAEALNALRDSVPVAIHAGHDHDAAIAPVIGSGKNPAVPKGENRAIAGLIDRLQVSITHRLPAHAPSNDSNDEVADPADQPGLHPIQVGRL